MQSKRDYLENLEQTNPVKFHAELERFAADSYVLCKDNAEDVTEAMYADADVIDHTFEKGLPKFADEETDKSVNAMLNGEREYREPFADRRLRSRRAEDVRMFANHILTCLLFGCFGAFFMMLWLIEPHEIIDVAEVFWGVK